MNVLHENLIFQGMLEDFFQLAIAGKKHRNYSWYRM